MKTVKNFLDFVDQQTRTRSFSSLEARAGFMREIHAITRARGQSPLKVPDVDATAPLTDDEWIAFECKLERILSPN